MRKALLPILLFICLHQLVWSATYKVASAEEFKNVLTKLLPGDDVIIANGTYTNWNLEIPNSGTKAKPITIKAEKTGNVIFSGEVNKPIFLITGKYITLDGLYFKACSIVKADGKTGVLIELRNTVLSRITNCSFLGNVAKVQFTPLTIVSGNGMGNIIDSCYFIGNIDNQDIQVKITTESCPTLTIISDNIFKNKTKVSWKNGNGGECIQIGQDPVLLGNKEAVSIVTRNHFTSCNGENEVISNKSSKNSYSFNVFENNDGELVMRGGHDCKIDNNIFEGGTGGIRVNGTGHIITNNSINNIKTAIRLMYGMAKGKNEIGFYIAASNCIISNNKISNAITGILIGDSKDADWTGKFDTTRYPSPVKQSIAPFDNKILGNTFLNTKTEQLNQ